MLAAFAGLFAWSFAAATVLPLSSELPFGYLVRTTRALALPVTIATVGNYLGACTTYWLARAAARSVERRRSEASSPSRRTLRAMAVIRRYGAAALLLSWVPVFGDALVVAAGALRTPFKSASLFLIAGKAARYLAVGWAVLAA